MGVSKVLLCFAVAQNPSHLTSQYWFASNARQACTLPVDLALQKLECSNDPVMAGLRVVQFDPKHSNTCDCWYADCQNRTSYTELLRTVHI